MEVRQTTLTTQNEWKLLWKRGRYMLDFTGVLKQDDYNVCARLSPLKNVLKITLNVFPSNFFSIMFL